MEPEISYLIVSFNSEKYISKCITSILNKSHTNFEIIVIDNNSKDGTISTVENFCTKNKQIKLITNTTNIGYANAIAKGIEHSQGEFLAILNADSFLDKNWTSNLLRAFISDNKIMSASGTIYLPSGELQSSGGMMDKYGAVIQRGSKSFFLRNIKNTNFFYNDGSSFMVRRQIFQETSFDPKLFLYYEDVDLSWKIRMLGYKIEHVSDAISYHDVGHSFSDVTLTKFYYMARNRLYVCQKNYSLKNVICRIPTMLLLIFLNAIFYDFSKKQKGYTWNFFKAIGWNLINLRCTFKEQKRLRSINKITDSELDEYLIKRSVEIAYLDRKSTRLNSSHIQKSRMPSSA